MKAKTTNKVIVSRAGRMPIFNRPTALNASNTPRVAVAKVNNRQARQ